MPGRAFPNYPQRADPTSEGVSLEDLRREPAIYPFPECDNDEELRECLQEVCGEISQEQLNGWSRAFARSPLVVQSVARRFRPRTER
jgi:hypothetical protein